MDYKFKTKHVCSREISFSLENGIIKNISFLGGCDGNLKALSKVLDGMPAQFVIDKLSGNTCQFKPTSCADQLAMAVRQALEDSGNNE